MLYLHIRHCLLRFCWEWDNFWHNQGGGDASSAEVNDRSLLLQCWAHRPLSSQENLHWQKQCSRINTSKDCLYNPSFHCWVQLSPFVVQLHLFFPSFYNVISLRKRTDGSIVRCLVSNLPTVGVLKPPPCPRNRSHSLALDCHMENLGASDGGERQLMFAVFVTDPKQSSARQTRDSTLIWKIPNLEVM